MTDSGHSRLSHAARTGNALAAQIKQVITNNRNSTSDAAYEAIILATNYIRDHLPEGEERGPTEIRLIDGIRYLGIEELDCGSGSRRTKSAGAIYELSKT